MAITTHWSQAMSSDLHDAQTTVFDTIRAILERRSDDSEDSAEARELTLDTNLQEDLMFDSLEVAEISAVLEDSFGDDPYTAGLTPQTVRQILDFYGSGPR